MIEKIIASWKKKEYKPIYWLEGEEVYYIDKLCNYAEDNLLTDAEKAFNLTILYGKDAEWQQVVNACKRYPMQSDLQVIIVKEAQLLKDIEKIESYVEKPLSSSVLIIAYKNKKIDGRTKFSKTLKEKGEFHTYKKMYDDKLPEWTSNMIQQKGLTINNKALILLTQHIGNDLNRLENEVEKLQINLSSRKTITEDDIENYVGISKEYNIFELQNALATKNLSKAIQIISYFGSNPKAAPMMLLLPTLYSYFSKLFLRFGLNTNDDKAIASHIGVHPFMVKDYIKAANLYQYAGVEKAILLLQHYNLKSIGINNGSTTDSELLKEMCVKIIYG